MEQNIIAVSQVNEYIKFLLDRDELLTNLCVRGEVSNYKIYPSGHHYFTLKDAEGALKCVMFRSSAQRLRFRPENGMQVIAYGRVTVFPRDGAYQLYCSALTADGAGDLYVAFEQLKEKLSREGLFDPAHKKPLPRYPHTIAIITSAAGAAIMALSADDIPLKDGLQKRIRVGLSCCGNHLDCRKGVYGIAVRTKWQSGSDHGDRSTRA